MTAGAPGRKVGARLIGACAASLALATAAIAHEMLVGVKVDGEDLSVEVRYDDGSISAAARVVVSHPDGSALLSTTTDAPGGARIPLAEIAGGALIEAFDDDGHASYRILTPVDLEAMTAHP